MATVYKLHTKGKSPKGTDKEKMTKDVDDTVQNKQRVLMLSSRGITHR